VVTEIKRKAGCPVVRPESGYRAKEEGGCRVIRPESVYRDREEDRF
jgi:hypothetical protein